VDGAFVYDKLMHKPFFDEAMIWAQVYDASSSERRRLAIRHAMQMRWGSDADVAVLEIPRPPRPRVIPTRTNRAEDRDVVDLLSSDDSE
jgi:hypothetical protein